MVTATILRNLQIFTQRAFVKGYDAGKWQYKIGKYIEQNKYDIPEEWKDYNGDVIINSADTFFARTTFVPEAPGEGQFAFLNLDTAQNFEAIVKINGKNFGGINISHGRQRIYLLEECYGKQTDVEIELFASNHARGEWDARP